MRPILLSIVAYVILTFALGFIWNLILFKDLYAGMTGTATRPNPIIPLGLIAVLLEAITMSLAFRRFHNPSMGLKSGLVIALGLGLFSMTYASLVVPAKFAIEPVATYSLIEIAFGLIHYALAGFVFVRLFAILGPPFPTHSGGSVQMGRLKRQAGSGEME